jgi:gamma-glutamylcyclotransferase (GGCT)/AIG2-like uncharacterized protein YtfP
MVKRHSPANHLDDKLVLFVCGRLMTERLFVYGTLGPGRPNEHVLSQVGGNWAAGRVKGVLRQEGWGAAMGYPGIDLSDQGEEVQGFVFSSDNFASHWDRLDDFEGEGYARVLTTVYLEDDTTVDAYIYTLMKG